MICVFGNQPFKTVPHVYAQVALMVQALPKLSLQMPDPVKLTSKLPAGHLGTL